MSYTAPSAQELRNRGGTITDKIATELGSIQTAIADAAEVTKVELPAGFLKVKIVAGAAAGDVAVSGIAVGDELVFVGVFTTAASIATFADLTAEFTVGAGKITNTGGTSTLNNLVQVIYIDCT